MCLHHNKLKAVCSAASSSLPFSQNEISKGGKKASCIKLSSAAVDKLNTCTFSEIF